MRSAAPLLHAPGGPPRPTHPTSSHRPAARRTCVHEALQSPQGASSQNLSEVPATAAMLKPPLAAASTVLAAGPIAATSALADCRLAGGSEPLTLAPPAAVMLQGGEGWERGGHERAGHARPSRAFAPI